MTSEDGRLQQDVFGGSLVSGSLVIRSTGLAAIEGGMLRLLFVSFPFATRVDCGLPERGALSCQHSSLHRRYVLQLTLGHGVVEDDAVAATRSGRVRTCSQRSAGLADFQKNSIPVGTF